MKGILYLILGFIFISTIGFSQNTDCRYSGYINGWCSLRCACCEGWLVKIDGKTFLTDSIPNSKEILGKPENQKFPIPVYLDFKKAEYLCERKIVITCIKKR